mmetsp:Transcript_16061/g.27092  ORF Transcript_16061/g.27092 Transcript_16061/m.27092 type:complete len:112 (+) Transcript_16061:923-1258(+)
MDEEKDELKIEITRFMEHDLDGQHTDMENPSKHHMDEWIDCDTKHEIERDFRKHSYRQGKNLRRQSQVLKPRHLNFLKVKRKNIEKMSRDGGEKVSLTVRANQLEQGSQDS